MRAFGSSVEFRRLAFSSTRSSPVGRVFLPDVPVGGGPSVYDVLPKDDLTTFIIWEV